MKFNTLIILCCVMIACKQDYYANSSSQNREQTASKTDQINGDSVEKKERYPAPRDSFMQNYVNHRKPPKDSINKWNAEVMAEKEKHTQQADDQTKKFTIDPKTGEVYGCPLIKFKGYLDEDYWIRQKSKRDSLRRKFKAIRPMLRASIMQDKEGELWYGDPKNVEIEGSPEAVHSGRGPIGFLFTDDGNNLIVPVGYPHGGMMDEIFFFDRKGNLLSKIVLDKSLNTPSVDFNTEQTFVVVSNEGSGDFYFFKPDGALFGKGNFNEITGDRGTSYGKPLISKSGKYWVLNNNIDYVYDLNGHLLAQLIIGGNSVFDEMKHRIIFTYGSQISIYDLLNNRLLYLSNYWAGDNIGFFTKGDLFFTINNKNFRYEIAD